VDLLNRHSGIVWDPGRFAEFLRGEDARRSANPLLVLTDCINATGGRGGHEPPCLIRARVDVQKRERERAKKANPLSRGSLLAVSPCSNIFDVALYSLKRHSGIVMVHR